MAYALTRSFSSMHRLASNAALPGMLLAGFVQPASITSLLAWHNRQVLDHRKLYSSEDKQHQQAVHDQQGASTESTSSSTKPADSKPPPGSVTKTLLQDPADFLAFFTQPWRNLMSRWNAFQIQRTVETSFQEDEFLEGAKDAWFAVSNCMTTDDYEKLAPMCAPGLMSMFKDVFLQEADKHIEVKELAVQHAHITGATFLSPATPGTTTGDPGAVAIAEPLVPVKPSADNPEWLNNWLMKSFNAAGAGATLGVWVKFSGCLSRQLVKDRSGNLMQEIEDKRSSTWFFVRGPLPDKLPVRELDVPWQVMGFE